MTILFMGGEMGAFVPADSNTNEATTSGSYNSTFSRCSIRGFDESSYAESAAFTAVDELYVHYALYRPSGGGSTPTPALVTSGGTEVFRVLSTGSAIQMQALIAAVWTNVGSSISVDMSGRQDIDLYIDGNSASGTASLYISGTLRTTATADLSAVASINKFRGYGASGNPSQISQIIIADEPTIGMRLFTVPIAGVGASTDWTGSYTNIDEIVYSDADFINSATADQVSTFAVTNPTLTGYQVRAVAVTARAKRGASGPANLQLALRSAGTNYFSGSKALDVGYTANAHIWETDPATASAWQNSAVLLLQPGVKSIT
jgi:hypothetical protein